MISSRAHFMLAVVLAGALGALAADPSPVAAPASAKAPIPAKEITTDRVFAVFQNAMIECEKDDKRITLDENGMKVLVAVDADKKVISFVSLWSLKEKAPMFNKLRMANTMNDETLMVRFAVSDATTLWCDFQVPYDRSVLPSDLINWYRKFSEIVRWAVASKDPEDLIGADEPAAAPETPAEDDSPATEEEE